MRSAVAWTLVAAVAVWTVGRVLGLERGFPLFPLMAYTPAVAVAAAGVVVVCGLLRRRAAAAVALVLALVLGALVAPRALGGPSGAAGGPGPTVGVMSANLLFGGADAEAIVALARAKDVEVLSVQELTPPGERQLRAAGLDALMPHRVAQPRDVALYATVPLTELPSPPGLSKPVAMAAATFGDTRVQLAAVHPPPPQSDANVAALRRDLPRLPPAEDGVLRILAGDFNSTLDHAGLRELIGTGYEDAAARMGAGLKATWPANRRFPPPVTIDHVLVDRRIGVQAFSVHDIPGSDHRAVFAEVELPALSSR